MEEKSKTHFKINFLGIKLSIVKPQIFLMRKRIAKYKNPQLVPQAKGDLRLIQLLELQILKEFNKFATENNLNYWLDFGTLLGAVRHRGFIPWDDDIDLGMMREDYDRLCEILPKYDGNIIFTPAFGYRECCFVRIMYKNIPEIFVDIFPYDYFYKKLDDEEKIIQSNKISEILEKYSKYIHAPNDFYQIREKAAAVKEKYLLENKLIDKSSRPDIFMGIDFPHAWKNKFYSYEDIFPFAEIEFEGEKFPCPNKSESVLKSIFGDYMKMPKDLSPKHFGLTEFSQEERQRILDVIGEVDL